MIFIGPCALCSVVIRKKTGAGKNAWLEKIRAETEEDYDIPPLDD